MSTNIPRSSPPSKRTRRLYRRFSIHKALRGTPAIEAGVADHVWSLEEIAGLG